MYNVKMSGKTGSPWDGSGMVKAERESMSKRVTTVIFQFLDERRIPGRLQVRTEQGRDRDRTGTGATSSLRIYRITVVGRTR